MPHLQGERSPFTDPSARAGFLNISADTTAAELARSVLEGTALNYAALADCMSLPLGEPLPVVGGGANSALWMQTLSDCLQRPLLPQPDADAVAARGCAAEALLWLGQWPGDTAPEGFFASAAPGKTSCGAMVEPDESRADMYAKLYKIFRELHPALKGTSLYSFR